MKELHGSFLGMDALQQVSVNTFLLRPPRTQASETNHAFNLLQIPRRLRHPERTALNLQRAGFRNQVLQRFRDTPPRPRLPSERPAIPTFRFSGTHERVYRRERGNRRAMHHDHNDPYRSPEERRIRYIPETLGRVQPGQMTRVPTLLQTEQGWYAAGIP